MRRTTHGAPAFRGSGWTMSMGMASETTMIADRYSLVTGVIDTEDKGAVSEEGRHSRNEIGKGRFGNTEFSTATR